MLQGSGCSAQLRTAGPLDSLGDGSVSQSVTASASSSSPSWNHASRMDMQVIDMDGCVGSITTFIVEPYMPHQEEFYLCIQSQRLGNDISFSQAWVQGLRYRI